MPKTPDHLVELGDILWKDRRVHESCIFEFHGYLGDDLMEGGVIESASGRKPAHFSDIKLVLVVKTSGEVLELSPNDPRVLSNLNLILDCA